MFCCIVGGGHHADGGVKLAACVVLGAGAVGNVPFNFKIEVLEADFFYVGIAETRAPILNFALQMRFSMLY